MTDISNWALSADNYDDSFQKLEALRLVFEGFMVNLTIEERSKARTIGNKGRWAYVDALLRAGKNFEQVIPRDIDMAKFEKMTKDYQKMKDLEIKVKELNELMDDTIIAVGQEIMFYTDNVYKALKQARNRDSSIDNVLDEITERNKKFGRRKKE